MKHSVVMPIYLTRPEQEAMTLQVIRRARECASQDFELVIFETKSRRLEGLADVYMHEPERHPQRSTYALNRLFERAQGEFITILTNDVFVQPGWLTAMEQVFGLCSDAGAASVGAMEHYDHRQPRIVEGNHWAVAMLSRKCWKDVGEFDPEIPGVWNDTDYLMRIYEKGYRMYKNLSVVVFHLARQTEKFDEDHMDVYVKNQWRFFHKHENSKNQEKFKQLLEGGFDERIS
jgi:GT2 family glycosyltransferase